MVPPLWRKVMDQRLMDFYDGDPSLVNVDRTDRTAVRRLEKLTGARAQS